MEDVSYKAREGESVTPGNSKARRTIRRMHSFDRGIKIANQHKNPDHEERLPSYMRQTCASLVKRITNKARFRHSVDCPVPTSRDQQKEKRTSKKTSKDTEGKSDQKACPASPRSDGEISKGDDITTPWSNYSVLVEDQRSLRSVSVEASNGDELETLLENMTGTENFMTEENQASVLLEECYEEVIRDTLASGRTSPGTPPKRSMAMRGPSISSNLTLEDAYSEVAQDESFCYVFDSDDDDSDDTQPAAEVDEFGFTTTFFQSASTDLPPVSTFTAHSEQLTSSIADDIGKDMEANRLEGDEDKESEHVAKLESHRLEDVFLDSWTDSELSDDLAATVLERGIDTAPPIHSMISFTRQSSCDSEFDIHLPLSDTNPCGHNKGMASNDRCTSPKAKSSDDSQNSGSYRIQGPSLLWMLGGNVLAGVIGATLASAGIPPLLAEEAAVENEEIVATPRSDVAYADDWFFQASSSRVSHGK